MKKIALFIAVIAAAQFVSASQIISQQTYQNEDGSKSVEVTSGFSENGFGVAEKTCFVGSSSDVCSLIAQAQAEVNERYSSGDHGTFTVNSCITEKEVVKVSYTRSNDWNDDEEVQLDIERCSERK